MWPRTDATVGPGSDMTASRRTKSTGLSGFVSFMRRKDAENALREFDGFDWGGSILRVGWSKAVPIAAKPLYGSSVGRLGSLIDSLTVYVQFRVEPKLNPPEAQAVAGATQGMVDDPVHQFIIHIADGIAEARPGIDLAHVLRVVAQADIVNLAVDLPIDANLAAHIVAFTWKKKRL